MLKDQALKIIWAQRIMRAEIKRNFIIQNKISVNLKLLWNMNFRISIITNMTNPIIREVITS